MIKKKTEQLDRDDYWMGMAFLVAAGSKNPVRQQGAVLVGVNSEFINMACDGLLKQNGVHCPHAEINVLLNAKSSSQGGTIYITNTPCYHCALAMSAALIKRVVYFSTEKIDDNSLNALQSGCVQAVRFQGNLNWMRDYMKVLNMMEIFDDQRDK